MQGKLLLENNESANIKDFENHLATIFTEARLKKYIEIRSLDTCEWDCHCSGPAFYTGLLYGNLDAALEIINKWNISDTLNAYIESPKKGFETMLANKTLLEWSKIFLDLAKKGLESRSIKKDSGNKESIFLMIRRPPRSTRKESSAASDVYKRQEQHFSSLHMYYKKCAF